MRVDNVDLWGMLLYSVRYSLGRSTYAPAEVVEWVVRYHDALSDVQLQKLAGEIAWFVESHRVLGKRCPCEVEWRAGAERIRALLDSRA